MKKKTFRINKSGADHRNAQRFIQCATEVDKSAIRHSSIDGVEHIIVSSYTLPDDIVMNDGLYPADEIANSYQTLERTLAPVEHPRNAAGDFLSASDPIAIHNFHAGAFNMNVTRANGRVHMDKYINVQEAMKTDRGKRLLDRIKEIQTSDNPRPIHTSVGVFIEVEDLDKPMVNKDGMPYKWIARNLVFDHDAILLDSVGAAQPDQGVGMAVNKAGQRIQVDKFLLDNKKHRGGPTPFTIHNATRSLKPNATGLSLQEIYNYVQSAIKDIFPEASYAYVVDIFADEFIFETDKGLFSVEYALTKNKVEVVGLPQSVERKISYVPKITEVEKTMFKEMVMNALTKAGVKTDGLSDEQLLEKYQQLQNQSDEGSDIQDIISDAVSTAIKPVTEKLTDLESKITANTEAEKTQLIEMILNSKKYTGMTKEIISQLDMATIKTMAASCKTSQGIPLAVNFTEDADAAIKAPSEMPE